MITQDTSTTNLNGLTESVLVQDFSQSRPAALPQTVLLPPVPVAKAPRWRSPWVIARSFTSRFPRRRNPQGDRLPSQAVCAVPLPDDVNLAETPLGPVIDQIRAMHPLDAGYLAYLYDQQVLTALHRIRDTRLEAEAELAALAEQACEQNDELDKERAAVEATAETALAPHRREVTALEAELAGVRGTAARTCANLGLAFDPSQTDLCAITAVDRISIPVLAGELNLPNPAADSPSRGFKLLGWGFAFFVGSVMGLALGLWAGFIHATDLLDEAPVVLGLAAAGVAFAAGLKMAIHFSHRQAAERYYRALPWPSRVPVLILAFFVDLIFLMADLCLEYQGLMKMVTALDANGSMGPLWLVMFGLLVVSGGFVVTTAWAGYLEGRAGVLGNRLLAEQEARFRRDRAERLCSPETREALRLVTEAGLIKDRLDAAQARLTRHEFGFQCRLAEIEARRPTPVTEFPMHMSKRLQDAEDDARGAYQEWLGRLEAELDRIDPTRAHTPKPALDSAPVNGGATPPDTRPASAGFFSSLLRKVLGRFFPKS